MMWTLRAAICLALACVAALEDPEDCGGCFGDLKNETLESFILTGQAVEVWSEVTTSLGKTVVREVYEKESNRSLLEYNNGTASVKLLYDRKEKLLYRYLDYECTTFQGSSLKNFLKNTGLFMFLDITEPPEGNFIGPAALFDKFSATEGKSRQCAKCEPTEPEGLDRGIPCVLYGECETGSRFWYTEKEYLIYDQGEPRPLRMDLKTCAVDIMSIKVFEKGDADMPSLFVPTGLSCGGLKSQNREFPLDTSRHAFESEVIATTSESPTVFVYELSGLIVPSAHDGAGSLGIYSFLTNTFANDGESPRPLNRERTINDVDHKIFYRQIYSTDKDDDEVVLDECFVSAAIHVPTLELPVYGRMDITSLFLAKPEGTINYLGVNRIRFEDTDVFEVTAKNAKLQDQFNFEKIVTTYHFSTSTQKLMGVIVSGYNAGNLKFTATIHVTKYDNEPTQLNERLRVDHCFSDKSDLRWFQIGFATDLGARISESEFTIREAFVNTLYTWYHVEPMRIPQVNVEFLDEQVNIKALLLERPEVVAAFDDPMVKDLRQPTKTLGIMSEAACLATCLGMNTGVKCTAISYCGATCSISDKKLTTKDFLNSTECALYTRKADDHLIVSSAILRDLEAAATHTDPLKQLRLKFEVGGAPVELIADSFDVTSDYDAAFHFDKKKVAILESAFALAAPKKRYTSGSLGSLDLEDCALACANRKECESFSFCDNSRECSVSKSHEVVETKTAGDSHCIIYQVKYVNRFEKLPGLSIKSSGGIKAKSTNDESCAQQCIKSDACLSFEFCEQDTDFNCLLLSSHIADAKAVAKTDKNLCAHYSKKFLYDYQQVRSRSGTAGAVLSVLNNTSPEACAKQCSEWAAADTTCLSFDFCGPAADNTGLCTLRTQDNRNSTTQSNTCDFYHITKAVNTVEVKHGAGSGVGFSVLMIIIGIAVGFGGLYGYNMFRGA